MRTGESRYYKDYISRSVLFSSRISLEQVKSKREFFNSFLYQRSIHIGTILVLSEPMGAKGPKFSSDDRVHSFIRAAGSASSLQCPAQGFPVPSFR